MTTSPDTCNKCGARLYIRKTPRDCIECGAKCTGRRIRCDPCHQRHYLDRHRETTRRNREKKRARGEPLYVRKTPRDCIECGAKCTGRRTRCDPCHQRHYLDRHRETTRRNREKKRARGEPLYVRKTPRDCIECGAKCTGRRTRCDPCHQRHYRTYYRDAMRIRRARKKLTDTETTT